MRKKHPPLLLLPANTSNRILFIVAIHTSSGKPSIRRFNETFRRASSIIYDMRMQRILRNMLLKASRPTIKESLNTPRAGNCLGKQLDPWMTRKGTVKEEMAIDEEKKHIALICLHC